MQEFSNFENLQFVKNTKFSKFSQNLNLSCRDLRPKKKMLQFTQRITKKKLAEIEEPMVPTFGGLANIDPPAKMSLKHHTEDISYVCKEISSMLEENHTQKKIFTFYRRINSFVTEEILLSLHLLLQKICFLGTSIEDHGGHTSKYGRRRGFSPGFRHGSTWVAS
jgi:hypothetical protein